MGCDFPSRRSGVAARLLFRDATTEPTAIPFLLLVPHTVPKREGGLSVWYAKLNGGLARSLHTAKERIPVRFRGSNRRLFYLGM